VALKLQCTHRETIIHLPGDFMKKSLLLSASLLLTSLGVQAIPPPPLMPPAIGYIGATLNIRLNVTDTTKCDGFFCEQKMKECNLEVRIPVTKSNLDDESYYPETIQSVDGKTTGNCEQEMAGYKHSASLKIYATVDEATQSLKIITDTRSNKSTYVDLSTDNSQRSINLISTSLPSFVAKNSLYSKVNKPYDPKGEDQINSNVATTI
jgi:hypothetical protein